MQCPTCTEGTVAAFCRNCGKGVCPHCRTDSDGIVYCAECAPTVVEATAETPSAEEGVSEQPEAEAGTPRVTAQTPMPPPPPPRSPRSAPRMAEDETAPHPVLAGILGVVPGLGAVYNGQYVKGVIHVVIFGMLLTIASNAARGLEPLFVPMIGLFLLYMPIEAFRTAQAMRRGERADEMSGLVGALFQPADGSPVAGVALIAVGILLLLFSLGVIDVQTVLPAWPLLIVGYGVFRLYRAMKPVQPARSPAPRPQKTEPRPQESEQ